MKKGIKISIILSLALIFCFALISCGNKNTNEPETEITTSGLNVVDGVYQAVVDAGVSSYDLMSKIKLADGAKIIFSASDTFDNIVDGRLSDTTQIAKFVDRNIALLT